MLKTNLRRVSNTGQFSTSQSTGHHVACSAGVFWVGETLFMFVFVLLYKPPSLILWHWKRGEKILFSSLSPPIPRPLPAPFDSPHFLLSWGSFNMALSRAKTFARPKKTPALQASHHDTNKCIALKVSASPNPQLPKCSVWSRRICVVWWFIDGAASDQYPWTVVCHLCYTRPLKCFLAICVSDF